MLRSRIILAVSVLGFAALGTAACGGGVESTEAGGTAGTGATAGTAGTGGTGGMDEPSGGPGVTPIGPGGKQDGDGAGTVLAIHKLYLGDTDRNGTPSPNAWKLFGFDLDGKTSAKTSTDLCKPAGGAKPSAVNEDGEEGRDNSFGKIILPIVTSLAADASTQINDSIDGGAFTIMLSMEKIGNGDNYNPLLTKLYGGARLVDDMGMDAVPKWDGSDVWPVIPELLMGGDITKPLVQFESSYLAKDPKTMARTWVSGSAATIKLNLSIAGFTLGLDIHSALISADLSPDNTKATNGTIAGIINTDQLIMELAKIAGSFDKNLCPPSSTFESIAGEIRQASDILTDEGDGNHQDPSKTCDGISIGLGFDSDAVKLGPVAKPADPQADPCK